MHFYVLSDELTTGQVTFIFRVAIQVLSFVGLFLLGKIILGNVPNVAPVETHDTFNRIVGSSTATWRTILWIKKRLVNKSYDSVYRTRLLFAFFLWLCYGLFISLSDVGFIGLQACSVPFPSFHDSPASIHSDADARVLVLNTMIQGTDPSTVRSLRCDSATASTVNGNETAHQCNAWNNSTYNDISAFISLNLTDTDALMFKNFGQPQPTIDPKSPVYYFGARGTTESQAKVSDGLAVIPHPTGVRMLVGSPDLGKNETVSIPKSMAVELSFGCLPLGIFGEKTPPIAGSSLKQNITSFFIPDPLYKPSLAAQYAGPDQLFDPLVNAANSVRQLALSSYNKTGISSQGYYQYDDVIVPSYTWRTQVQTWINNDLDLDSVLRACSDEVHAALNVTTTNQSLRNTLLPRACDQIIFSGSLAEEGNILLRSRAMICAAATAVNMVQSTLWTDGDGVLTATLSPLPSHLYELSADTPFNSVHDTIHRYTLSDNPSGNLTHYILQNIHKDFARPIDGLFYGSESVGFSISQLGNTAVGVWLNQGEEVIIDGAFFSLDVAGGADDRMATVVTKWAGEYIASVVLSSFALVGYTAVNKPQLRIDSLGGRKAVCYQPQYVAGFIPLLLAAFVILVWSLVMLIKSQFRGVKMWEKRYGGLGPAIVTATLDRKLKLDEPLEWEDFGEKSHLYAISSTTVDRYADE
ncbi:hypothetical protein CPB83DRAFT_845731 [Crepidotus variabilis]|uniref:Uncharacterized protein n=1 Tax=Crepidotus variabilis TaxID=179855 RepID=A0A9P6ENK8_9AGAR|nr:hypothetical protein CPB83DRAFT_845731 [Crepidotus variabilis]